ncbi:COG4280 domain-containing protein [Nostoc sp. PCC 7107]|uniref:COG4280 domain-containing protein n=1 Tax=Nostoc sp. PCC 7107 TaxID=317936 RepID=UPI00029F2F49|nr:COG4280 domain-containing protein [Nostoc sp. PCC 7107]AFY40873.1 hypothetical protein Nos7107_0187 [Nostoc sp. PCC 7107]
MNWEIFLASFVGSLIELVEILGLVLIVGKLAGWRNAFVGAGSGIGLTLLASLILGTSLTIIPVDILRIVAGVFLLAFGQKWTRSIVKYYAGIPKKRKDEEDDLETELANTGNQLGWNWFAIATTFKGALLDSVEVAIAVVTLGATGGKWLEAAGGASAAAFGLVVVAFLFRTPLNQVPIKPMKFTAAMLLMGFGIYWLSEGFKIKLPGDDWAIVWLPIVWGCLMAVSALLLRWQVGLQPKEIVS